MIPNSSQLDGLDLSQIISTVSPPREATWLVTEGGLSSEFINHGLYGENVFQMTG